MTEGAGDAGLAPVVNIDAGRSDGSEGGPPKALLPSSVDPTRTQALRARIDALEKPLAEKLKPRPDQQTECLERLIAAEALLVEPVDTSRFIEAKKKVLQVEIELARVTAGRWSILLVGVLLYIGLVLLFSIAGDPETSLQLQTKKIFEIPATVIIWSCVGALTAMLLRSGQFAFNTMSEAWRWMLYRFPVGVVMGIVAYVVVNAGMVVVSTGSGAPRPEFLWMVAFIGSFSDTLSINLLNQIMGRFELPAASKEAREPTKPPT